MAQVERAEALLEKLCVPAGLSAGQCIRASGMLGAWRPSRRGHFQPLRNNHRHRLTLTRLPTDSGSSTGSFSLSRAFYPAR